MALNRCQAGEWEDYTRLRTKQQIAFWGMCHMLRIDPARLARAARGAAPHIGKKPDLIGEREASRLVWSSLRLLLALLVFDDGADECLK